MSDKPFGKYGCFIDDLEGGQGCVFDGVHGFTVHDCSVALELQSEGKGKNDCEFWQEIQVKTNTTTETVCPACGHHF